MVGMVLGSHKHSSKSLLKTEYDYCVRTEVGARKSICILTVEYYLANTKKEYREIEFKDPNEALDADEIIVFNDFNRKKIDGYFDPTRTANLPDELAHFVAWAIDELYKKGICTKLRELCFPSPAKTRATKLSLVQLLKNCNSEHADNINAAYEIAHGNINKIPIEALYKGRIEALESGGAVDELLAFLDEVIAKRVLAETG